ncbi:hypothetical protein HG535_0H02930 [Zygotorulaspora mrakii]|uniref:Uncharacterized protein n=1 Tax=Zygotorulaspora mrakii TaxID=42260 RepID=A0A7H9B9B9_ZYGMR|nr:uncharacterized protein HG535_0H02930 [Zygotorulaspora mrakii]QLG74966.1 hypothetical protein HG535_0H02930 [Zygotorulaspora mrakii]
MHLRIGSFVRVTRNCMMSLSSAESSATDDNTGYSKLNGKKNQSVTKPVSLDSTTGEVLVRTSTGKTRVRRGQSDEEYKRQLHDYFQVQNGPKVTEVGWMDHENANAMLNADIDFSIKPERQKIAGFCRVLYYRRQYSECAELCGKLIPRYEEINKNNKIRKEINELGYMLERSRQLLQ